MFFDEPTDTPDDTGRKTDSDPFHDELATHHDTQRQARSDVSAELSPSQKRLAERAVELKIKSPNLPFATLCMDGQPWEYHLKPQGIFPSVLSLSEPELAERLGDMGTFWSHQGVLEFVDDKGQYQVARHVQSNVNALERAGFKESNRGTIFANNSPSGKANDQLRAILSTPENENERLQWAVRDANVKQFDYALAHGADPTVGKSNRPLLLQAIAGRYSPERHEIIRKLLAKDLPPSKNGENAVSVALANPYSTLALMSDLLKAGHNPFQRTTGEALHAGVPAFLGINPKKETAREELKLVIDHMLGCPDLSKLEMELIRAHHKLIDDALIAQAKTGSSNKTEAILEKLTQVWEQANKFNAAMGVRIPSNDSHIPQQVQDFLRPLTDAQRAPKLMQTLMACRINDLEGVHDLVNEFTMHVVLPQVFPSQFP